MEVLDTVGPLNVDQEVVTRFETDLASNLRFYTDNNGLELQERLTNVAGRPGDASPGVAIAGNFYPAVARAILRDEVDSRQFSVLSQSTHAVSSLASGQIEVMLHRRCSRDDARGMNEPLADLDRITAPLRLVFDGKAEASRVGHRHVNELQFPPNVLYGLPALVQPVAVPTYRGLRVDLPENVHLISANPRNATHNEVIVRLLHQFEADEHPTLSQPVTVSLDLFNDLAVLDVEERTLTLLHQVDPNPATLVTLNPLQIATYVMTVAGTNDRRAVPAAA